ncbi:MAG: hypothetical protein KGL42_02150 [Betaproteobacteria bacterium]|nr:hypothetical protein [Betaproteobacteria bacterium]
MHPYTQGQAMPGMEFFQSLLKGSGLPTGFASWMAPTMDPKELEQKITDLKAVLQWLEANAKLTQATIQTLEVQRMTLSALKTMNVDLGDLAGRMTEAMQAGAQAMGAAAAEDHGNAMSEEQSPAASSAAQPRRAAPEDAGEGFPLPGVMDPMQWWNAVSQQFSQVATQALRESPWPMPQGANAEASAAPPAPGGAQAGSAARRPKQGRSGGSPAAKPTGRGVTAAKRTSQPGKGASAAARTKVAGK